MNNLIYIAQLNSITGDIEYNQNQAIDCIKEAVKASCDLIIFPENFLDGNLYKETLERYPHLFNQHKNALDKISCFSKDISILIGGIKKNNLNCIYYLKDGKIIENPVSVKVKDIEYGIIPSEKKFDELLYKELSDTGNYIVISSDISRTFEGCKKHKYFSDISKKYQKKLIYLNKAGANDELVFEGCSRIYNENGEVCAILKSFEQDCKIIDLNNLNKISNIPSWFEIEEKKEFSLDYDYDLERTYKALICAIKNYFSKNGFKRAVLGLSGGLDSSVCAVLCKDALGAENVLGISMPSKITSSDSKNDALKLADNLKIHFFEMPIKELQDLFSDKFETIFNKINWCNRYTKSYTQDNIQARTRATILWGIANEYPETIPIATSDKSESYMGYATINGDMSGGFAPILDITKTKLFALARWMNKNRDEKDAIPINIIQKPPGAELAINPKTGKTLTAEEALMPYEFLDEVIWRIENSKQTIDDMMRDEFLYEKKNKISSDEKLTWLEKFFTRMNHALYKWYISVPAPIIDAHSINKAEFKHPITSNIKYKEN